MDRLKNICAMLTYFLSQKDLLQLDEGFLKNEAISLFSTEKQLLWSQWKLLFWEAARLAICQLLTLPAMTRHWYHFCDQIQKKTNFLFAMRRHVRNFNSQLIYECEVFAQEDIMQLCFERFKYYQNVKPLESVVQSRIKF